MKRLVLIILVLFLLIDLSEDGSLGKVDFNLPQSPAQTFVTSSDHPDSGQTDFRYELASTDLPGSPPPDERQLVTLQGFPLSLQLIHCCLFRSSGGLPR
jgi:hypothetical protein